jgi:hypothetical protein
MLEERSSGVACDYGLHLGLLKTLHMSSPGDTLPTLKKGGPLSYETLLASGKGCLCHAGTIALFLDTRSHLLE